MKNKNGKESGMGKVYLMFIAVFILGGIPQLLGRFVFGWPAWTSIPIAIATATAAMLISYNIIMRNIRRRKEQQEKKGD